MTYPRRFAVPTVFVLGCATLASCARTPRDPSAQDEASIYGLVLDSIGVRFPTEYGTCLSKVDTPTIVLERTMLDEAPYLPEDWREAPRSLRRAWVTVAGRRQPIPSHLTMPWRLLLLDSGIIDSLLPRDAVDPLANWRRFYRRYPNACSVAWVSAIALDATGTWAAVAFAHANWWLSSQSFKVLLKREQGAWRIHTVTLESVS